MKNYTESNLISFLKTLAALTASYSGKDLDKLSKKVKEWARDADPFVKAFGMQRPYTKLINKYIVNEDSVKIEDLDALCLALKDNDKEFDADTRIGKEQKDMINRVRKYILKDSEPSFKGIMKDVHVLGEPELTKYFIPEDKTDHRDSIAKAKALTKKQFNEETIYITTNQAKEWKEKDSKAYAKYIALVKPVKAALKTELVKIFRSAGKDLMDIDQISKTLDANGISYSFPKGFKGQIDQNAKLYTNAGIPLKNTPRSDVKMNPNYDPQKDIGYVCMSTNPLQHYYTLKHSTDSSKTKFDKVYSLVDKAEIIKAQWRKLFESADEQDKAMSVLLELVYQTSARIGSKNGQTDGKNTYGIRTLLSKHVVKEGNGLKIKYPAKGGIVQEFHIAPGGSDSKFKTRIITTLLKLKDSKNPDKPIFEIGGHQITYAEVNKKLKKLGLPEGIGIHKFRHAEATALAIQMFKSSKLKRGETTQKEAEKWLAEQAQKIGDKLGHTTKNGSMALGSYIDPTLSKNFFDDLGLRYPNWLQTLLGKKK